MIPFKDLILRKEVKKSIGSILKSYLKGLKALIYVLFFPMLLLLFSCDGNEDNPPQPTLQYTITFDSREGSPVAEFKVAKGEKALRPVTPTKAGYTFVGWYKEVELRAVFYFHAETIIRDITLYAKWEAQSKANDLLSLILTLGGNQVAGEIEDRTVKFSVADKSFTTATIEFMKISDEATSEAEIGGMLTFTSATSNLTVTAEDTTITKTYTLKLVGNQAQLTSLSLTIAGETYPVILEGQARVSLAVPDDTVASATIQSLTVLADATANPAEGASLPFKDTKARLTVTAEDGKATQTYTVALQKANLALSALTLTIDGAGIEAKIVGTDVYVGVAEKTEVSTVTIQKITVGKGASASPASGESLTFTSSDGEPTATIKVEQEGATATYTVKLQNTTCKMTSFAFEAAQNGGIGLTEDITGVITDITEGEGTITLQVPALKSLSFIPTIEHNGVSITPATGEIQAFSTQVTYKVTSEYGSLKTYTVTAIRKDPVYTLKLSGGIIAGNNPLTFHRGFVPELLVPTRADYRFLGWFTDADLMTAYEKTPAVFNRTLYAKWEATSTFSVTFKRIGDIGPELGLQHMEQNQPIDHRLFNQRPYGLLGLYKDEAGEQAFTHDTAVTADMTLHVKWGPTTKAELTKLIDEAIEKSGNTVDLNYINISLITDMSALFQNKYEFNGDISGWNVAAVRDMSHMFYSASAFNQDISGWNVAKVINMSEMFAGSGLSEDAQPSWYRPKISFESQGGTTVDPIYVLAGEIASLPAAIPIRRAKFRFEGWYRNSEGIGDVFDFTVPIEGEDFTLYAKWEPIDTFSVTFKRIGDLGPEIPLGLMYVEQNLPIDHRLFNQFPYGLLGLYKDEAEEQAFDIETVVKADMTLYVKWGPVTKEELTKLIDEAIEKFGNTVNLNYINTSLITNMSSLFYRNTQFNGDISGWNVGKVIDMTLMFSGASAFNGDISGWNVGKVIDMALMFSDASAFNGDISGWNVATGTRMLGMFAGSGLSEDALPSWYLPKISFESQGGTPVESIYALVGRKATAPPNPTHVNARFEGWYRNLEGTGDVFDFTALIERGDFTLYAKWLQAVTFGVTFKRIGDIGPELGLQYMEQNQPIDDRLFNQRPYGLLGLYKDEAGEQAFTHDTAVTADMTLHVKWGPTTKAELTKLIDEAIERSGNTVDLNYINTSLITNMSSLFYRNTQFNGDISGWNVAAVRDMRYMFSGAVAFNQDISGWNVAAVTDMGYMFYNASAFNQDLENWNVATSVYKVDMFTGSGVNKENNNIPSWY